MTRENENSAMDIVKDESVNVCNSVLVSGLTQTEVDGELERYLQRYGSISRVLVIDDPKSEYHLCSIVEFANSSAMHTLRPTLPTKYQSLTDGNVIFHVRPLDSVYTSTASCATKGYLEELQAIANKTGRSFESVLQEELMKISSEKGVNLPAGATPIKVPQISEIDCETENIKGPPLVMQQSSLLLGSVSPEVVRSLPAVFPPSPSPRCVQRGLRSELPQAANFNVHHQGSPPTRASGSDTSAATPPVLTVNDVNPPAVQRVVVEHVMLANDAMSPLHSSVRLRPFSGKMPRPNSELDYDTGEQMLTYS